MKNELKPIFRNSDEAREWEGGERQGSTFHSLPSLVNSSKIKRELVVFKTPEGKPFYKLVETAKA